MNKIRIIRDIARLHLTSNVSMSSPMLHMISVIIGMDDKEFRDFCRIISLGTEEDMTNV